MRVFFQHASGPWIFRQKAFAFVMIGMLHQGFANTPELHANDTAGLATACSGAIVKNVSLSLPGGGTAMGTQHGPAQVHPNPNAQQCMQRLTITSTPCGATIYVDAIQSGRTPITFPMPPGRYTVVLAAPGHQPFAQRILISNAPLEVNANLVPVP